MNMARKNGQIVLALLATAAAAWAQTAQLTTLYTFTGGSDGGAPETSLSIGKGGVLYGSTYGGGSFDHGVVFQVAPPATPGNPWTEEAIYNIKGSGVEDYHASGPLAIGGHGVLYGAEILTGDDGKVGSGELYSLTPPAGAGEAWTYKEVYDFGEAGYGPATILMGAGGVFYGSTGVDEADGLGTIFSIKPPAAAGDSWAESALYQFPVGSDGTVSPQIVVGSGGVIFGTLAGSSTSGGVVFSLTPPNSPGSAWTEKPIYTFSFDSGDAADPGPLTLGGDGTLYGVTAMGGPGAGCTGGCATVFSLTPPSSPGESWTETVLYSFSGPEAGVYPNSVLVGPGGVLYGTGTTFGGPAPYGMVYSLTPQASPGAPWTVATLYTFSDDSNGAYPNALTVGADGVLYGTTAGGTVATSGTVFALRP
jgi:uncharacterized repeat protein (TIGR03803 family)